MGQVVPSNVETFGTLIVVIAIVFYTLLFAGTLQFLYLRKKSFAKIIKRRAFRYPMDYRMNCIARRMRDSVNEGIPELIMALDIGCPGSEPYASRRDRLQKSSLPQSLADVLTYGFLADDLTEDEYHYIEKVVQSTTAIQHKIQAPARKAANDNN
ncbi:Hypothetical protein DHA2_7190 [Giardia duodenalis]|uniref:Uncharacterized protein n=1 Tax=Giardia intestinalis TaxID=5741 RepID=V6TDV6_GIAIN|nr:Hypothetical protein DHA2_7190 [Giardia intestinalis]